MSKKTPSVLFYPADYLVGVVGMTWDEQGRYMHLLCLQQQKGHLDIMAIMPDCPASVMSKFVQDDDGLYYNERMDEEMEKRYKFVQSRRQNLKGTNGDNIHMESHMDKHMESHMADHTASHMESHMAQHMDAHMDNDNDNDIDNYLIVEVINYLNDKTKKSYKTSSKKTREKIRARIREGYTLDDFHYVIDVKSREWLGTSMEQYLRPETLFGTKFEGYLNQQMPSTGNPFLDLMQTKGATL